MKFVTALLAGALFGSGLLLSGMTNPATVLSFLDLGGAWNPALALTMAGAIIVAAPAFHLVRRRDEALDGRDATLPRRTGIDTPLLVGGAIFGLGWGMSGICPGPGLVLLTGLSSSAVVFAGTMALGMRLATVRRPRATGGDGARRGPVSRQGS